MGRRLFTRGVHEGGIIGGNWWNHNFKITSLKLFRFNHLSGAGERIKKKTNLGIYTGPPFRKKGSGGNGSIIMERKERA